MRHRKLKIALLIFAVMVISIAACFTVLKIYMRYMDIVLSKRTNIIFEGHFSGHDSENESLICDLYIDSISEEEYLKANGENVIQDAINGKFYSLEFLVNFSETETKKLNFLNFKDAYNGATGIPIDYVDEYGNRFYPISINNSQTFSDIENYYSVTYKSFGYEIYTFLYFVND